VILEVPHAAIIGKLKAIFVLRKATKFNVKLGPYVACREFMALCFVRNRALAPPFPPPPSFKGEGPIWPERLAFFHTFIF